MVGAYKLEKGWADYDFCVANGCLVFSEGNNVRILSPSGELEAVTEETEVGIICGKSVYLFDIE